MPRRQSAGSCVGIAMKRKLHLFATSFRLISLTALGLMAAPVAIYGQATPSASASVLTHNRDAILAIAQLIGQIENTELAPHMTSDCKGSDCSNVYDSLKKLQNDLTKAADAGTINAQWQGFAKAFGDYYMSVAEQGKRRLGSALERASRSTDAELAFRSALVEWAQSLSTSTQWSYEREAFGSLASSLQRGDAIWDALSQFLITHSKALHQSARQLLELSQEYAAAGEALRSDSTPTSNQ